MNSIRRWVKYCTDIFAKYVGSSFTLLRVIGGVSISIAVSYLAYVVWVSIQDVSMSAKVLRSSEFSCAYSNETREKSSGVVGKEISRIDDNNEENWSYSGDFGPEHWGKLNSVNLNCSTGVKQSPINVASRLPSKSVALGFPKSNTEGHLVTDKRTVEFRPYEPEQVTINSESFIVQGVQFHTPSEHESAGLKYPMEIQINLRGKNSVKASLAIFVVAGLEHPEIKALMSLGSQKIGDKLAEIRLDRFIPSDRGIVSYNGSQTSPPCEEGVHWGVFNSPIELSYDQIKWLRSIVSQNSRPVQDLAGREIKSGWNEMAH